MLQLLTVCTGNVCRSPLAQLILAQTLAGQDVEVSSAGTHPLIDAPIEAESARLAREHGVPAAAIEAHRARWLNESHLASPDLVLAMAREHRTAVVELAPARLRSTFTMREFARLATHVTDADATATADAAGHDPSPRLAALLAHLARLRSDIGPPDHADDDDVLDPYGRSSAAYDRMASELMPALDQIARIVAIATAADRRQA